MSWFLIIYFTAMLVVASISVYEFRIDIREGSDVHLNDLAIVFLLASVPVINVIAAMVGTWYFFDTYGKKIVVLRGRTPK